jgi:hypothetical protein
VRLARENNTRTRKEKKNERLNEQEKSNGMRNKA